MPLSFVENGTDTVDYGSAASLDNLTLGTMILWLRPSQVGASRAVLSKTVTLLDNGPGLFQRNAQAQLQLNINRATVLQRVRNTTTSMAANRWQYCAFTWDTVSGGPKSYTGSLTQLANNTTTDAQDGSGAQKDDAAQSWLLGNDTLAAAGGYGGDAGFLGLWNRTLTQGELWAIQETTKWHRLPSPAMLPGCVLWTYPGDNGTSMQRDLSHAGNHGTVTGPVWAPLNGLLIDAA